MTRSNHNGGYADLWTEFGTDNISGARIENVRPELGRARYDVRDEMRPVTVRGFVKKVFRSWEGVDDFVNKCHNG